MMSIEHLFEKIGIKEVRVTMIAKKDRWGSTKSFLTWVIFEHFL